MSKKRFLCLVMTAVMAVGASMTAYAKDYQGKDGWLVSFDGEKMNSNFQSQDLAEDAGNIQPGDSILLKVNLKNDSSDETDWYMTNTVIKTLEEESTANGGAYEYRLAYKDASGEETVLYDSASVGGESAEGSDEGLRQATNSLEDYFYLARLASGGKGTVLLKVGVDGETQGNAYQETLARLQMNFAAEKVAAGGTETRNRTVHTTVKTGDGANILLFSVLALVSGLACMVFAGKRMRRTLLSICLTAFVAAACLPAEAKAAEGYSYKITLAAGDKGSLTGEAVQTAQAGDWVSFNLSQVEVNDPRYYVKGVRLAGRDNQETLASPGFHVTGDADYVVAYGIKGDQVAYTVRYLDADGNELAPSDTYYGNIGDKPVVAYRYIEGYVPRVLAFTKTLAADESENVFTFEYEPGEAPAITETTTTVTTVVPGTAATAGAGAGAAAGAAAGGNAPGAAEPETEVVPDEDVPLENQDVVDLDDEDTPLANIDADGKDGKGVPLAASIAVGVTGVLALAALAVVYMKKRVKK